MTDKEIKAKVETDMAETLQYLERDLFCNTFYKVFGKDFDEFDLFYDVDYKSFLLWNKEDTWYIYSRQFDVAVSWYKHLGRINQCTNEFLSIEGLETFFIALKEEYNKGQKYE